MLPARRRVGCAVHSGADAFHVGDTLPLQVIEFEKDSKKIVLSVVEYLKGKDQAIVDEYASKHQLSPETLKDTANITGKPDEGKTEGIGDQPPTSDFLI